MRRWWWLFALAGCGFHPPGQSLQPAEPGDASPDTAPPPPTIDADLGAWGSASALFAGVGDDDPTLTGDLLQVFFNREGGIWVSTRGSAGDMFGDPVEVSELSTGLETTPEISNDGLTMYFSSSRAPSDGNDDVWMSTRATGSATWSAPIHVAALSSSSNDLSPTVSADGLALVMSRDPTGSLDLYESTRATTSDTWGTLVALTAINSSSTDEDPILSLDQLAIYYDSTRDGDYQLWMATRASTADEFGSATKITSANTLGAETDPWISPDSRHLFFASNGTLYQVSR